MAPIYMLPSHGRTLILSFPSQTWPWILSLWAIANKGAATTRRTMRERERDLCTRGRASKSGRRAGGEMGKAFFVFTPAGVKEVKGTTKWIRRSTTQP